MNDKVKVVLNMIVEQFKSGQIVEPVAYAMFPIANIPSARWSLLNRTIMFLGGTADARGYRQWIQSKRQVIKGAKAIHILVPYMRKVDKREAEEEMGIYGFGLMPVFKFEDTEGEPLAYQQLELPELPLKERAEAWGINVKAVPGNFMFCGYFNSRKKEIGLASPEENTFFHELAHAAHERYLGAPLKGKQDAIQEIVAELSAAALCRLVGKTQADSIGNSYLYIERYAKELKLTAHAACSKVLTDTEKVLALILSNDLKTSADESAAQTISLKGPL